MAVYARGPSGGVIEHDKPKPKRQQYGKPRLKPDPKIVAQIRRQTLPIKIAGAVMRRVNKIIRSFGVKGLVAHGSFEDSGYHLHFTLLLDEDKSKVAMFAENPKGNYRVWP